MYIIIKPEKRCCFMALLQPSSLQEAIRPDVTEIWLFESSWRVNELCEESESRSLDTVHVRITICCVVPALII